MEASEEPRDASAGRWQAGALPASKGLGRRMAGCGRTGAVGVTPCRTTTVRHRHAAQRVSTKAMGAVHRRMRTCIGAPQVGQRAARGRKGVHSGGWPPWGGLCPISRRMVVSGTVQLAWRKPK